MVILVPHKADSEAHNITGNKEGDLIMIKNNNPKCLCIYSRALKYKRKTVVTANRQTHKYSQRFQSPLSITDRNQQGHRHLNTTINQRDPTNINSTLHSKTAKYTILFVCIHNIYHNRYYGPLNKFQ